MSTKDKHPNDQGSKKTPPGTKSRRSALKVFVRSRQKKTGIHRGKATGQVKKQKRESKKMKNWDGSCSTGGGRKRE